MNEAPALKIFISAGEVSGDLLGARLIAALRRAVPEGLQFAGIGGTEMQRQGMESLFPISDLAVMGVIEIIPHIPRLKRRIAETAEAVHRFDPDILITIDAPGFNKRLAVACGPTRFPKLHYVAPTVWAWRPKRVHAFKALFDRLLCLLPFEPPYFEAVGLKADFVGHSILESGADKGDGAGFRRTYGIGETVPLLCVLPGSRRGEVDRLLPIFRDAVSRAAERLPGLHVVMPTVPHLAERIEKQVAAWALPVTVIADGQEKYDAMAAANAALAASGTVALELAMARVPTVIAYRINGLTYWIVNRLIFSKFAHILNILARREIVPERIQDACRAETLADDILALLSQSGSGQMEALAPYLAMLEPAPGILPSDAAAQAVLDCIATHLAS